MKNLILRNLCLLLMAASLFYGCEKESSQPVQSPDEAVTEEKSEEQAEAMTLAQMKQKFENDLLCFEKKVIEINLYTGLYKNEQVYFTMIMCPACNTAPPAFGYTLHNKKVKFDNFQDVTDIKEVYNSCTKTFTK